MATLLRASERPSAERSDLFEVERKLSPAGQRLTPEQISVAVLGKAMTISFTDGALIECVLPQRAVPAGALTRDRRTQRQQRADTRSSRMHEVPHAAAAVAAAGPA